jgi:hypothetical protein
MKKVLPATLALFMLSVAAIVSAEDTMTTINTLEPNSRYLFTGHFKRVKGKRKIDTIVLAENNTDRDIFIDTVKNLSKNSMSQSLKVCIGNQARPYDGPVEIVSSISRMGGDWISLRIQDASCKRLPR